jgi:hypothetical protein
MGQVNPCGQQNSPTGAQAGLGKVAFAGQHSEPRGHQRFRRLEQHSPVPLRRHFFPHRTWRLPQRRLRLRLRRFAQEAIGAPAPNSAIVVVPSNAITGRRPNCFVQESNREWSMVASGYRLSAIGYRLSEYSSWRGEEWSANLARGVGRKVGGAASWPVGDRWG